MHNKALGTTSIILIIVFSFVCEALSNLENAGFLIIVCIIVITLYLLIKSLCGYGMGNHSCMRW